MYIFMYLCFSVSRKLFFDNGPENLGACIEFYAGENIMHLITYLHAQTLFVDRCYGEAQYVDYTCMR